VGTITSNADVLVGGRRNDPAVLSTAGFTLTGRISEIILYSAAVNEAQRIIIHNYLSAKYNITLAGNNVYTMDNAGNDNYDFDVAGIGQAADGSSHRDSRGSGIVRMWNPNALADSEFLMWGHDGATLYSNDITDVDGTIIEERLSRTWRVSESADVGTVSVSFDLSQLGTPLGSNLRLLIDRNENGFADNDVTPVAGSFADNIVVFSGINFQNGDRFSLGNTDLGDPLPVELTGFRAVAENHVVRLNWATASETNNNFFTVERSKNAKDWQVVKNIPGAGTSHVKNYYETVDDGPYSGASYYRLKQTDFDTKFKYFNVVRVVVDLEKPLVIYPNPFNNSFKISADSEIADIHNTIKLFTSSGIEVPVRITKDNDDQVTIDPGSIPGGLYLLKITNGSIIKTVKVVKSGN
jgi:hypothetical protein